MNTPVGLGVIIVDSTSLDAEIHYHAQQPGVAPSCADSTRAAIGKLAATLLSEQ